MNAWKPYEPDTSRARELDRILRDHPQQATRTPRDPQAARRQNILTQHRRRIAYLRRGGRHEEADAEEKAYEEREANRAKREIKP
jgi:hypothetical protein